MSSLFNISLSGLQASSDGLQIIANNLSNLNTAGYKDQIVNFQDLYYQTIGTTGAGNPEQVGEGVEMGSTTSDFSNGTISQTGVPTDMAISGNGFFMTEQNGLTEYTRAGDFQMNSQGEIVTQNGQTVMGYPAVAGVVTPGSLQPLQVSLGATSPPLASTTMQLNANLDAGATVGTTFTEPMTVYDSLGNTHTLSMTFTNTGTGTWSYQITIPGADVGSATPVTLASGTLAFNGSGNLISPTSDPPPIAITGLADGANPMSLTWDLYSSGTGNITQTGSTSSATSTNQNGYGVGTLQTFNVASDGTIQGVFSNGQTMTMGQVALASFSNDQGLQNMGGNSFAASASSGAAVVGTPGSGSLGTVQNGALEGSNVDIATEFTRMLTMQQGYQASARVITTADQLMQDTMSLIQ